MPRFVLTIGVGRPLRQLDRAISELGEGTFTNPIAVRGPHDLERLGVQLEWLRQRLLELAHERNRFLRHMSHELKTPLANIREGTELLMDGAVGELDSNQREVTGILRENGIKLQRLIENLLSFSAWQTSRVGLAATVFRLRPLEKQVLENQQPTLLSQRVRLDVRIDDVTLLADRGKIRLILENLVSNAVKYSPKGGTIHLQASTPIAAAGARRRRRRPRHPGGGSGTRVRSFSIPAARRTPAVKGTGIGLSVVLEFVAAHGGTIQIIDGQYPGAHFRITMPIRVGTSRRTASAGTESAGPCRVILSSGAVSTALLLAGCTSMAGKAPLPPPPVVDQVAVANSVLSGYLQVLQNLLQGLPAQQAEIVAGAQRDYDAAPTPSRELKLALILGTTGHPATDLPRAQKLLREVLANPEMLLPGERALALLKLSQIDDHLTLETENRRLQSEVMRLDHERVTNATHRLQAELDENARLRKELDEARAKLQAIFNIERSLNERKPGDAGR